MNKSIGDRWNQFLFRPIDVAQYSALRIGLGTLVTIYFIQLLPFYPVQFSQEGWLATRQDLLLPNSGPWSVLFLLGDKTQTLYFFLTAIFCASAFTLGFFTKVTGWISLIALISVWNQNPLILDGDDAILRVMLFYLLLSPCGRVLSLDSGFKCPRVKSEIWPLRLIQFQLALIYFVSGWVKFHSPEWQDGSVLQYVLIHPEYSRWDFTPLLTNPFILLLMSTLTFIIMWWEVLFPFLLFHPKSRCICIFIGIAFHLGLLIFMNLRWFSEIMLVLYLAFVPDRYFRRFYVDFWKNLNYRNAG